MAELRHDRKRTSVTSSGTKPAAARQGMETVPRWTACRWFSRWQGPGTLYFGQPRAYNAQRHAERPPLRQGAPTFAPPTWLCHDRRAEAKAGTGSRAPAARAQRHTAERDSEGGGARGPA